MVTGQRSSEKMSFVFDQERCPVKDSLANIVAAGEYGWSGKCARVGWSDKICRPTGDGCSDGRERACDDVWLPGTAADG